MSYPEQRVNYPDIYTFQETRSSPDVVKFWKCVLPGKMVFTHGSSRSRGIILGVHPYSPVQIQSSIKDSEGRYVIAECKLNDELFTVVSVYFEPTIDPDNYSPLLTEISSQVNIVGNNRVLWVGDFNVALNPILDTTTTAAHTGFRGNV